MQRGHLNRSNISRGLESFQVPGRIAIIRDQDELTKINVTTPWSSAEIYLQGAHVTRFQKHNEPPLLFLSRQSRFIPGQAIRGGIPVIFPWFGKRSGYPAHGFARTTSWDLLETTVLPAGGVSLRFSLPSVPSQTDYPTFTAHYAVTVTDKLEIELVIANTATEQPLPLETCLHTYFAVSDVRKIAIEGLEGHHYLDELEAFAEKEEKNPYLQIMGETDRIYTNHHGTVTLIDPGFGRKTVVKKQGSASTVLWNPWVTKSKQMTDFGDDEYLQMICVESGNIRPNGITLPAGQSVSLRLELSSEPV